MLKPLSTGHVLLRNEEELLKWLKDSDSGYRIPANEYPCLVELQDDAHGDTYPAFTYLSDAQEMVKALEEAGATEKGVKSAKITHHTPRPPEEPAKVIRVPVHRSE